MLRLRTSSLACAVIVSAFVTVGCGKVKSMLGQGGEDGGSSGGGILGLGGSDELGFLTSFEGQVDLQLQGKMASHQGGVGGGNAGDKTNVSLLVKDKKIRADLPEKQPARGGPPTKGFIVVDAPARKAFVVTDTPEKMALVFEFDKMAEQVKGFSGGGLGRPRGDTPSKPPPKVTKTGKTDKVAGYTCENWDIQSDAGRMSLCVAKKGFSWLQIPMAGAGADMAWAAELLDGSHVPLRAIVYDKANPSVEAGRAEVTKIEKKSIAPATFEIPPGYPQMTLEQMMGKMMQGLGGAGRLPPGAFPPGALPPGALPPGVKQPKGAKPSSL